VRLTMRSIEIKKNLDKERAAKLVTAKEHRIAMNTLKFLIKIKKSN